MEKKYYLSPITGQKIPLEEIPQVKPEAPKPLPEWEYPWSEHEPGQIFGTTAIPFNG